MTSNNYTETVLKPLEIWYGHPVRPGFYDKNGAHAVNANSVSFTIHSELATEINLLLFEKGASEPFAVIPYPKRYKVGDVYSMTVFDLDIENLEYCFSIDGPWNPEEGLIFDREKTVVDQYARRIEVYSQEDNKYPYRAKVMLDDFDWGDSLSPEIPNNEMIIYEMHVRGFTKNPNSNVRHPGTFSGLIEKIPYLKSLGVNVVELMPIFQFDTHAENRTHNGQDLKDYWGYNPMAFFAVNPAYDSREYGIIEGYEFKSLVKALHDNGMQVFLDVVFNHTTEGNEQGPYISFKGIDNQTYYMLTPEGHYYNFSGCGNTLNCNNPIVRQMILECLRYWVVNYRIDGFRFDLASILGRDKEGTPLSNPPLLESLAYDPILKNVELIAEAWDAGGLYQVGSFPAYSRWGEWNGRYRDTMRQFLKGDNGKVWEAAQCLTGSRDLYPVESRGKYASVNFITCHDGFTLKDLYSYNDKHNEDNGWNNTDGDSNNNSWNCGVEGETDNEEINFLRKKLMLNACVCLLGSTGIPMINAGDEFARTQFGNNNPYCQDNEISWIDWSLLEKNKEIFSFWKNMIAFRKQHPVLRANAEAARCGLPETSFHGEKQWYMDTDYDSHYLGIMYAGRAENNRNDEVIYLAINTGWENKTIELPSLPNGEYWYEVINTDNPLGEEFSPDIEESSVLYDYLSVKARSVFVLIAYPLDSPEAAEEAKAEMASKFHKRQKAKSKLYNYYLQDNIESGKQTAWGVPPEQMQEI